MPTIHADPLRNLTSALCEAVGTAQEAPAFIADSLVASDLAGHASHRVICCPQFFGVVDLRFFRAATSEEARRVCSATPAAGFAKVLMPSDLENPVRAQRETGGCDIDPVTWKTLLAEARRFGLPESTWATMA